MTNTEQLSLTERVVGLVFLLPLFLAYPELARWLIRGEFPDLEEEEKEYGRYAS